MVLILTGLWLVSAPGLAALVRIKDALDEPDCPEGWA